MVSRGIEIDELDKLILSELSKDSTKGYTKIAENLQRSHTTIKKHIDRLVNKGIIKKYTIEIDYEKLGYDIIAIIEISISQGKLIEFEEIIARHPNVFGVWDVTGDYDALVLVRFKTRKELSELIKIILGSGYVIRTNTHVVLNPMKDGTDYGKIVEFEKQNITTEDILKFLKTSEDIH
ncbi:MAG: Lrp/AsnC family transcriptional regulator [Candidatus Lokiarchaeota archaeon]|nr:Lrp/AsnC family transcriptional regulator [Candidatus Lokiarchaeota archaeon]